MTPPQSFHDFSSFIVDYILDDLQQSISRPGSSLGQPIANYSSQREVQFMNPVNLTTELRERSLSPSNVSFLLFSSFSHKYFIAKIIALYTATNSSSL
jgi:hypothetical protein